MSYFRLVTGAAGTGKTWWARAEAEQPGVILTSTTGISAISLGGTTINSLLRYFDTTDLVAACRSKSLHTRLRWLRDKGTKHIILDEVSMLSGLQLNCLATAIMDINTGHSRKLALTLVGDFAQLSPINEPFAFESELFHLFAANHTRLTEIHRQSDRDFVEALGAVRVGDAAQALSYFGDTLCPTASASFEGTTLKAKNLEVDAYNEQRLEALDGRLIHFISTRSGAPRKEWSYIPTNLHLKAGALVMILANARVKGSPQFAYVNGDLGILQDQVEGKAIVTLMRTGEDVEVAPVVRDNVVGTARTVAGSISYTPLRLAFASTIHKAQGLSLDRVQVDMRDRFFGQPSMLYTALSRCRTPEGLRIVGTKEQFRKRCVVNPLVRQWL